MERRQMVIGDKMFGLVGLVYAIHRETSKRKGIYNTRNV
jgi:hypothetical protein